MQIRESIAGHDDHIIVRHYLALWESQGTPAGHIRPDATNAVIAFMDAARATGTFGAFIASIDDELAGSVACQLYISPYPEVVSSDHRRFGYIWSVYVEPAHRRKGVAYGLVDRAMIHLRAIGCDTVVLNSSDMGEQLYLKMGFTTSKEMRMGL